MVLNLLRVEEINPEYMLEKSFYQFQHYRAVPGVVESKNNYDLKEYFSIDKFCNHLWIMLFSVKQNSSNIFQNVLVCV